MTDRTIIQKPGVRKWLHKHKQINVLQKVALRNRKKFKEEHRWESHRKKKKAIPNSIEFQKFRRQSCFQESVWVWIEFRVILKRVLRLYLWGCLRALFSLIERHTSRPRESNHNIIQKCGPDAVAYIYKCCVEGSDNNKELNKIVNSSGARDRCEQLVLLPLRMASSRAWVQPALCAGESGCKHKHSDVLQNVALCNRKKSKFKGRTQMGKPPQKKIK